MRHTRPGWALPAAIILLAPTALAGCFGGGGGGGTLPQYGHISGHVRMLNTPVPSILSPAPRATPVRSFAQASILAEEEPETVPGEVSVAFEPGASRGDIDAIIRKHGLQLKQVLELSGIHVLSTRGRPVEDVIAALRGEGLVKWASPRVIARLLNIPNDGYYPSQWHYPAISLPAAWGLTTGSGSVTVAVIDTGVETDHPDLAGHIVAGYDFFNNTDVVRDYYGHGTHVAGTIGAMTDNGLGVAGVDWDVRIMPLKVFDDRAYQPGAQLDDIAEAVYYATDNGAQVINMSLGIPIDSHIDSHEGIDDAIRRAVNAGVVLVAAAGNDGTATEPTDTINYPARNPNVIAVGAVRPDLARATWSSCGPDLDLVAPGGAEDGDPAERNVLSTWIGSSYRYARGTSMASPHVAGVVALMLARGVAPGSVRAMLQLTAMDLGEPGRDDRYGYGLVNAYAAVTGSRISDTQVFAGYESDGDLYMKSAVAAPGSQGFYAIGSVESGSWHVYGWIDVNRSGAVDPGDYFGRTPGKVTVSGSTITRVDFDISLIEAAGASRAVLAWKK